MSSCTKIDNRKKDILILGKGPTQGLEHTLSAGKMYSINLIGHNKTFCLSLLHDRANNCLLGNGTKIHKCKAKDSEIVATLLRLRNILKDFSINNMKDIALDGFVHNFIVDYDALAVDDILGIHKQLKKRKIK